MYDTNASLQECNQSYSLAYAFSFPTNSRLRLCRINRREQYAPVRVVAPLLTGAHTFDICHHIDFVYSFVVIVIFVLVGWAKNKQNKRGFKRAARLHNVIICGPSNKPSTEIQFVVYFDVFFYMLQLLRLSQLQVYIWYNNNHDACPLSILLLH